MAAALFATLGFVQRASAEELTIEQAIGIARLRAPEVRAARQRIVAAEGRRAQAGLFFQSNPEIEADWSDDWPFAREGERRIGAALSQEFEIAGQQGLRADVAERELRATEADVTAVERMYVGAVMTAFYDVLHAQLRVQTIRNILALTERQLGSSARRLSAGDIPELEHNLVIVETERARADVAAAEAQVVRARAELNRLLGRPATADVHAAGSFMAAPEQPKVEAGTRPQRLDVRALRLEADARAAEASLLRREAVPNLRLSLGWERETGIVGADDYRGDRGLASVLGGFRDTDDLFLIRLALPLPLWNRNQGAIQSAVARGAEAEMRALALEQRVGAEVEAARAGVVAAARRLEIYAAVLPRSEKNLSLLSQAFAAGEIDSLSLLAAQDRAFRTELDYLDAQREYAAARVALGTALGRDPAELSKESRE